MENCKSGVGGRVVNPKSGWSPALFGEGRVIWGREYQVSRIKNQDFHKAKISRTTLTGVLTAQPVNLPTGQLLFGHKYCPGRQRIFF